MKVFAIIPARGGSKGIPHKNLKRIAGRSLVQRCCEAALGARGVTRVFVTTDDPTIMAETRRVGAEVVVRPADLSGDTASSESALLHALDEWARAGETPDAILFLQATSPFTTSAELDRAIRQLIDEQADVVFSVSPNHRFQWKRDEASGEVSPVGHPFDRRPRRQEMKDSFVETGAFYLMRTAGFLEKKHRFFGKVLGCVVPPETALEIDDPMDLEILRVVARHLEPRSAALPKPIDAIIFDFDGVMTDNAAWVDQEGRETVRVDRGDGAGIARLRKLGVPMFILSTEVNEVVARRAEKLQLPCVHGVGDKLPVLKAWAEEQGFRREHLVYMGNDLNDQECLAWVGCAVVPVDAMPAVVAGADVVLEHQGGHGAVRELCDLVEAAVAKW